MQIALLKQINYYLRNKRSVVFRCCKHAFFTQVRALYLECLRRCVRVFVTLTMNRVWCGDVVWLLKDRGEEDFLLENTDRKNATGLAFSLGHLICKTNDRDLVSHIYQSWSSSVDNDLAVSQYFRSSIVASWYLDTRKMTCLIWNIFNRPIKS